MPSALDDPDRLSRALERINAARFEAAPGPARLHALYEGFEQLLDGSPPGGRVDRGPDGADSLAELDELLSAQGADAGSEALREFLEPILERLIESLLDFPETRLAAYGSLLPGEDNHHLVSTLVGRWIDGSVEGTLHDRGWAVRGGYPGFERGAGGTVPVGVLESPALKEAWDRLDAFEGAEYRRILVPVETAEGRLVANLYELADAAPA